MKRPWPLAVIAMLMLGSEIPPPAARLSYDLAGLGAAGGPCRLRSLGDCDLPTGGSALLAERAPPIAPPRTATVPERPLAGGVRVVVSLPQQRLYVFRDDELIATSPVSTGKPGHATPVGSFRILQKQVHHHPNRYSNAPMPYMERLTETGIALHAGHLPGYPASHGCIRLPWGFAKRLYGLTSFATTVTITRARPHVGRRRAS